MAYFAQGKNGMQNNHTGLNANSQSIDPKILRTKVTQAVARSLTVNFHDTKFSQISEPDNS